MRAIFPALALVAICSVSPALAAGPIGTCSCNLTETKAAGTLSVTEVGYSLQGQSGLLSGSGSALVDGDAVTFTRGPFPKMGITSALYNADGGGALNVSYGLGQTIRCLASL